MPAMLDGWSEIMDKYLHPEGQEMLISPGEVPDDIWDLYQEGLRNLREAGLLLWEHLQPIVPVSPDEAREIQEVWEREKAEEARLFEQLKAQCDHTDDYGSMVLDGRCMACGTTIRA